MSVFARPARDRDRIAGHGHEYMSVPPETVFRSREGASERHEDRADERGSEPDHDLTPIS